MNIVLIACFVLILGANLASSFSPLHGVPRVVKSELKMALMVTPPPPAIYQQLPAAWQRQDAGVSLSPLQQGIQQHVLTTMPSSNLLSELKERRPPTAEEIAQKKLNFNLWLWGGGVVAPFLATFYYFGFKFWEK